MFYCDLCKGVKKTYYLLSSFNHKAVRMTLNVSLAPSSASDFQLHFEVNNLVPCKQTKPDTVILLRLVDTRET